MWGSMAESSGCADRAAPSICVNSMGCMNTVKYAVAHLDGFRRVRSSPDTSCRCSSSPSSTRRTRAEAEEVPLDCTPESMRRMMQEIIYGFGGIFGALRAAAFRGR